MTHRFTNNYYRYGMLPKNKDRRTILLEYGG